MKLLLDSHILLWIFFDSRKLSRKIKNAVSNPRNTVCVSTVSTWEIATKKNAGKLDIPDNFFDIIYNDKKYKFLLIEPKHIDYYISLPLRHKDPFDRMLVAQAKAEQLTLVTNDSNIELYDVAIFG